jgi:hypothetical protein
MRKGCGLHSFSFLLMLLMLSGCANYKVVESLHISEPMSLLESYEAIRSFDVFVSEDQSVHLAVDMGTVRYYLHSEDSGENWSEPSLISIGKSNSKQGNDIQIARSGKQLLVIWKGIGELPGWGPAELAVSSDNGSNWQKIESPAVGDWLKNQGYFSLAADELGFHFFWLDDREEEGNTQGLRYAHSATGLVWGVDTTLETGLCTCCWISTTLVDNQLHALYRGEGPRDMRLITRNIAQDQWQPSVTVGAFDWDFIGCPHQGGALTQSQNGTLHSVVWTGKEAVAGLHYLQSNDEGSHWQYQQRLSAGEGQHAAIASQRDKVLLAWDSQSVAGSEIQLLMLKSRNDPALTLSMKSNGFAHPRVVASGDKFRLFWTDLDKMGKKRLKTAEVKQIDKKVQ